MLFSSSWENSWMTEKFSEIFSVENKCNLLERVLCCKFQPQLLVNLGEQQFGWKREVNPALQLFTESDHSPGSLHDSEERWTVQSIKDKMPLNTFCLCCCVLFHLFMSIPLFEKFTSQILNPYTLANFQNREHSFSHSMNTHECCLWRIERLLSQREL